MSVVPLPERRERLAAIDVGSNSIRLLVAEYGPNSGITVIDEVKEQPRLATGVAQTGQLDPAAMDRAVAALGRMQGVCERRGVARIAAVATSNSEQRAGGSFGMAVALFPILERASIGSVPTNKHSRMKRWWFR